MVKFAFCFTIVTMPDDWVEYGKWKVYFYYRKWPWAHNDNYSGTDSD